MNQSELRKLSSEPIRVKEVIKGTNQSLRKGLNEPISVRKD